MTEDRPKLPRWSSRWPLVGPSDSPPPTTSVQVEIRAQSRRGPMRSINDDHYVVVHLGRRHDMLMTSLPKDEVPEHFEESGYGMVVADGMGSAGEAASRLAVTTLLQLYISFGRWSLRVNEQLADELMDRAERFYRNVDSALLQASHNWPGGSLQSTLTACYSAGSDLFFAHVGDSRAYMLRDDELIQLTRDHTRDEDPIDTEDPTNTEVVDLPASDPSSRQVIAETLGRRGTGATRIDVERVGLLDGDLVLLCTNGLTERLDHEQIAEVLRRHGALDDMCEELIGAAVKAGATDDVTVVLAHYRIADHPLLADDDAFVY